MTAPPLRDAWSQHRLPRRLALLAGLAAAIPIALSAALLLPALAELEQAVIEDREALAESLAQRLDGAIDARLAELAGMAQAPGFDLADVEVEPERHAAHVAWLHSRDLESVSLVAADGQPIAREPGTAPPPPAIDQLAATSRPAILGPARGARGSRLLLVVPLNDWRGLPAAWAVAAFDPAATAWTERLRPVHARPDLSATLLAPDGSLIGRHGTALPRHADVVAGRATLRSAPGFVVEVRQLREVAVGPATRARRYLLIAIPLLLGGALLHAWGTARSITEPLAQLATAANHIAAGEIARPVPYVGADEVGRLGRALEKMREALHAAFDDVHSANASLEARVDERTAEIRDLYEKLRERDEWRRRILQRVIGAQEDERRRIARELHDDATQSLVALVMALDAAPGGAPKEARQLASHALDGLRDAMFDLRPAALDDLGLSAAIRGHSQRFLEARGVAVRCEIEELPERLPPETESAVFRIAQEAMANVLRHSGADSVLIQMGPENGMLRLEIEDDGQGFDPASIEKPGPDGRGLGLLGLHERAELLGGRATIQSSPGTGTRVLVEIPLPETATP
ncbi:MAG: HAMP domain-containing protein [Vicinamibacteria bacterium]|nr:HAMP domain-containing protein [Vicinamibacteria bacterium]